MIISLNTNDRFLFQSAVATQDIQMIINDLNSQLVYDTQCSLSTSILGSYMLNPVPMGVGGEYVLPYQHVEFETSLLHDPSVRFKAEASPNGFYIFITHHDENGFRMSNLCMGFSRDLTLTHFNIYFDPLGSYHGQERRVLMNAAFLELPTILGYIVDTNTRNRTSFTLGDPRQYEVRGTTAIESVQSIGDILQFTNPRENPTGITKRPHERAGHTRQLPDGRIIHVSPTTVHADEYEPDGTPRKLKH